MDSRIDTGVDAGTLIDRGALLIDESLKTYWQEDVYFERMRIQYLDYYPDWAPAQWLFEFFPRSFIRDPTRFIPFAPYHIDFWDFVFSIDAQPADPFVAAWPREGGKSTSAEAAVTYLACENLRRYCLYVCATQDRADDHVGNVARLLESATVAETYPTHSQRYETKFGQAAGWNVSRVWTEGGFVIDAIGLNKYTRGAKLEEERPDLIVIDDVDDRLDRPQAVAKKIERLTYSILPAGNMQRLAVLFVQNRIHDASVMAQILSGKADFLRRVKISGPFPTLRNFTYEVTEDGTPVITGGEPTWEGMDVTEAQRAIELVGVRAFEAEYQQKEGLSRGALWSESLIDQTRVAANQAPSMNRIVVSVDPATAKDRSGSEDGLGVAGVGTDDHFYALSDLSGYLGVGLDEEEGWPERAVQAYHDWEADAIVAEVNNGGDMVEKAIQAVDRNINVVVVHASRGKFTRAEPVEGLWRKRRAHIIGRMAMLEEQMCTPYDPDHPDCTFDRLDWLTWAAYELVFSDQALPHARKQDHPRTLKKPADAPPPDVTTLTQQDVERMLRNLYVGKQIECTAADYRLLVRMALINFAEVALSRNDSAGLGIANQELKRLDALFGIPSRRKKDGQ